MSDPLRAPHPPRRARALGFVLLAVVFLAGMLAGAAADRALSDPERPEGKRRGHRGFEAELLERLDLDARQRAEVERIFARRRSEAAAVWTEVRPRLQRVLDGTRDDLARVLTAEQLAEYERLTAERQRRMDRRFEGKGDRSTREP